MYTSATCQLRPYWMRSTHSEGGTAVSQHETTCPYPDEPEILVTWIPGTCKSPKWQERTCGHEGKWSCGEAGMSDATATPNWPKHVLVRTGTEYLSITPISTHQDTSLRRPNSPHSQHTIPPPRCRPTLSPCSARAWAPT